MDKVDYPVKAVFIPGQRGTEVLLDPLNNKMTKKSNEANGKTIYECSKKRFLNCPVKGDGCVQEPLGAPQSHLSRDPERYRNDSVVQFCEATKL